jgi:hypothetical protein
MIDILPPMPQPVPPAAAAKPANGGDFAAWLAAVPAAPHQAPVPDDDVAMPVPGLVVPLPTEALLASALPGQAVDGLVPPTRLPSDLSAQPLPPTPEAPALAPSSTVALPIAAPAVDAATATPLPAWQVAVHPADGVVELLSPWRLVAGASLSQIAGGRSVDAMALPGPTAGGASPPTGARAIASGALPGTPGFAAALPATTALPLVPMAAALRDSELLAAADAGSAPPAQLASAAQWALRLLRWFETRGEGATAWLRDYTATPERAAEMVDDLRQFARSEGLPLRRIVLNGQTVWSAEPSSDRT